MNHLSLEELDSSIYSKLKTFKVECIMLDWNFNIRVIDSSEAIYIDIDNSNLDGYLISPNAGDFHLRYLIWDNDTRVTDIKDLFAGSLDECIDHFRRNILMNEIEKDD